MGYQVSRYLFDKINQGVIVHSENGNIISMNKVAEKIFGGDVNKLHNKPIVDLCKNILKEDGQALNWEEHPLSIALKTGETVNGRCMGCRDPITYSIRWFNVQAIPELSEDDKHLTQIYTVYEEITKIRRVEEALKNNERRSKEVQRIAHIGNWELDVKNNKLYWSDEIYNIFEIDPVKFEATYEAFLKAIHPDDREKVTNAYETSLKAKTPYEITHRCLMKDGTVKHVHEHCETIFAADGSPVLSIGTVQDISTLIRAEEEKNNLRDQLLHAMKMEAIGCMAGGMAHDFNNLLTAISGNVSLSMMDLRQDDPLFMHLKDIDDSVQRAAGITRQLLAFSRKQIIEPIVVDLNDIVRGLEKLLGRLLGEDIDITWILEDRKWAVKVDPGQIEQVIVNLCINARDAMSDGGKLTVETCAVELGKSYFKKHPYMTPGGFVMLAVSDTGEGMDNETKSRIFEPFFTTKSKDKGTGLGLATSFGIVKQHGGHIEVYSEPGCGTTFKVYLPRAKENIFEVSKYKPEQSPSLANPTKGNETILLVEDEEMVRKMAIQLLSKFGYTILDATNGEEALEISQKHQGSIDLLLTDVVLPGINGRQLAEKLLSKHPDVQVLFTSGYTENVIVHHGVLDKGIHFIGKPYSMINLAHKIREVLDLK